jgi:hypothetical protein
MKCASCNAENPPGAKFCQACGVPLAMAQPPVQQPGAEPQSAGLRITPTAIGIGLMLLVSAVGATYVGWTWYEDSARSGATSTSQADEKAIEEKRRRAEQDRLADERQKALEAEREKQRAQADAQEAMKLAQAKAGEDQKRAADAAREAEEKAKQAEAKARADAAKAEQDAKGREAKAQQDAKAAHDAKAREAKAKEEARARELARQREAKARQTTTASTARPAETSAPAPAPVQPTPAPVAVAQAPVATAPAQNDPCAGLTGLKREQCSSCNRHSGFRKTVCENRAMERYCDGKWNAPEAPDCVRLKH